MQTVTFGVLVFSAAALTVAAAAILRNRLFATFLVVFLGLQTLITVGLYPSLSPLWPVVVYLQLTVCVHFISLARPRMRGPLWRTLITLPALFFAAGTLMAMPFAVAGAFGIQTYAVALPFVIAAVGVVQSSRSRQEDVHLTLDSLPVDRLRRAPRRAPGAFDSEADGSPPLRIAQITDPHLGPLMSVARMRGICERAMAQEPDLIAITGDFMTMESQADPSTLLDALEPLSRFDGPVFACFGNHDHEAPQVVRDACKAHGIRLLVDEEARLQTAAGPVQIIGADFRFRGREQHLTALAAEFPRRPDHLRLWLLHDPGAFRHLPDGDADLVLAGHTHGGQLGLLSLGLPWTVVSAFTTIPDHGVWALGTNRMYVHRGTGVYGFPLRVGVPGEESVLHIARAPGTACIHRAGGAFEKAR